MSTGLIWIYLLLVNAGAFGAFAFDKAAAESGRWRISESSLLLLALAGGSLGALIGQRVMRHKTRKEPFRSLLVSIGIFHLGSSIVVLAASLVNTF